MSDSTHWECTTTNPDLACTTNGNSAGQPAFIQFTICQQYRVDVDYGNCN